jgi:hypothetical protein
VAKGSNPVSVKKVFLQKNNILQAFPRQRECLTFFLWNVVLFAMRQEMRAERVRLMVEFFGTAGANSPE